MSVSSVCSSIVSDNNHNIPAPQQAEIRIAAASIPPLTIGRGQLLQVTFPPNQLSQATAAAAERIFGTQTHAGASSGLQAVAPSWVTLVKTYNSKGISYELHEGIVCTAESGFDSNRSPIAFEFKIREAGVNGAIYALRAYLWQVAFTDESIEWGGSIGTRFSKALLFHLKNFTCHSQAGIAQITEQVMYQAWPILTGGCPFPEEMSASASSSSSSKVTQEVSSPHPQASASAAAVAASRDSRSLRALPYELNCALSFSTEFRFLEGILTATLAFNFVVSATNAIEAHPQLTLQGKGCEKKIVKQLAKVIIKKTENGNLKEQLEKITEELVIREITKSQSQMDKGFWKVL